MEFPLPRYCFKRQQFQEMLNFEVVTEEPGAIGLEEATRP